ncbi:MAG TPA: alanine racemase, partial [Planctomycetota bacterium]|nr:alanine racemase [Planctomycetota bacterium]
SGIEKLKCTPNELDLLVAEGVSDIFLAYPLLAPLADRVARIAKESPQTTIRVQVAHPEHVAILERAAERHGVVLPSLIDLDVGNHRTGLPLARLEALLGSIRELSPRHVRIEGIHGYDGHNHSPDAGVRAEVARDAMAEVARAVDLLRRSGVACERVVVAGTPAWREDLRELLRIGLDVAVELSPGTFVFHDSKYEGILPGEFRFAALVFARVMDLPGDDRITLDLGHKRWAMDQGPIETTDVPGLEFISASEEHTVFRRGPDAPALRIGDPVWLVPRHVCPTVNLWDSYTFVREDGSIEENVAVDARNR